MSSKTNSKPEISLPLRSRRVTGDSLLRVHSSSAVVSAKHTPVTPTTAPLSSRSARECSISPPRSDDPPADVDSVKALLEDVEQVELDYIYKMSVLTHTFMEGLTEAGISFNKEALLGPIPNLHKMHVKMLAQVKAALLKWPHPDLPKKLLETVQDFNLYVDYHKNFGCLMADVSQVRKSSKHFSSVVKKVEAANTISDLLTFYAEPLGVVARYTTFFEQLTYFLEQATTVQAGHAGQASTQSAVQTGTEAVHLAMTGWAMCREFQEEINMHASREASSAMVLMLNQKIKLSKPLDSKCVFLREGDFIVKCPDGSVAKRHCFLFNDRMIETLGGTKKKYTGKTTETPIHMVQVYDPNPSSSTFTILIGNEKREYRAPNVAAKDSWVEDINKTLRSLEINTKVFGVPLDVLYRRSSTINLPDILNDLILYFKQSDALNVDGLFRISASTAEVNAIKDGLERGHPLDTLALTPHVATTLLSWWLMELPVPLVPFDSYGDMIQLEKSDKKPIKKVAALVKIVDAMPRAHRFCLMALVDLLASVAAKSSVNKMNSENLSRVFGPLLMRHRTDIIMEDVKRINSAVHALIDNSKTTFKNVLKDFEEEARNHEAWRDEQEAIAKRVAAEVRGNEREIKRMLTSRKFMVPISVSFDSSSRRNSTPIASTTDK
mmetsp:Transcript_39751/g.100146  ORF Transcript_39751/g.100146 Transcript_39751/m.100146 type:complete len:665 (+) Transcript_39751:137-2131(+)